MKTLLIITDFVRKEEKSIIPLGLALGHEYFLKCDILVLRSNTYSECEIKIKTMGQKQEVLLKHKFTNKYRVKFECKNTTTPSETLRETIENGNMEINKDRFKELKKSLLCYLIYEFPHENNPGIYINFEIQQINRDAINNLKVSIEKKNELFRIIDHYVNDRYNACMNDIGIIAEYFARELAQKAVKKRFLDFGSAVDALSHYKMTTRTKINYRYLGSLLWPLYYLRNQKLHPYKEITFNRDICDTMINTLSLIIEYLSQNKIKF